MASSANADIAVLIRQCRELQDEIDHRLDALTARVQFLTTIHAQLSVQRPAARTTSKRRRSWSAMETPRGVSPWQSSQTPHMYQAPVCSDAAPDLGSSWTRQLDEALSETTATLGTAALVSFDVSLWSSVHQSLTRRVGVEVSTPMGCFLRFRQMESCQLPFQNSEDALLKDVAGRIGWRWRQMTLILFSATKCFRSPCDLARRYMCLHPTLFWDVYMSRQVLWQCMRSRLRLPFIDVEAMAVSILSGDVATGPGTPPFAKMDVMRHTVDQGLTAALAQVNPLLHVEMLLFFYRDRWPIVGVSFDSLGNDAKMCASQLSLSEMAVMSQCSVDDVWDRVERALLARTRSPVAVNFEDVSRRLFGHTRCARIVYQVACEMERSGPVLTSV